MGYWLFMEIEEQYLDWKQILAYLMFKIPE